MIDLVANVYLITLTVYFSVWIVYLLIQKND